jgi:hypothetical protein
MALVALGVPRGATEIRRSGTPVRRGSAATSGTDCGIAVRPVGEVASVSARPADDGAALGALGAASVGDGAAPGAGGAELVGAADGDAVPGASGAASTGVGAAPSTGGAELVAGSKGLGTGVVVSAWLEDCCSVAS